MTDETARPADEEIPDAPLMEAEPRAPKPPSKLWMETKRTAREFGIVAPRRILFSSPVMGVLILCSAYGLGKVFVPTATSYVVSKAEAFINESGNFLWRVGQKIVSDDSASEPAPQPTTTPRP